MGAHFKQMYDSPPMHTAIQSLHAFLLPRGISLPGASLRWLYHHSALRADDGIILGATKMAQVESNVAEIEKGPLSEEVVGEFERLWDVVRGAGEER